jgi:hypothetical protein
MLPHWKRLVLLGAAVALLLVLGGWGFRRNDAGAMHSGHHWVWVLAQGYVSIDDLQGGKLPRKRLSEDELAVTFRAGRHPSIAVTSTYAVP